MPPPTDVPGKIYANNEPSPLDPQAGNVPRGLRNNNPLNIEAGSFTQGQPRFVGSDGRFAKFEAPEQGIAAANKLLDSYQVKGLNTPAAIIGRWAPQGENNSAAYASTVAKKLGIGPNDPITPEMRPALIAAMSEVENGKPSAIPQIATALGPTGDAALPSGATPAQGALPTAAQAAAPTPPIGGLLANVPPETKVQIAKLLTSNNPTARAMGTSLLQQASKPPEYGFQTLPDGTIVRTNPRTGTVEPTYQAPTKQTFGVIGEDENGKKTYGFIDAAKGKTTPVETAEPGDKRPTVTGPDGKEIVIPKGVDVPTFKKEVSRATADAATGKVTEVQGNAQQFANRMESAENNFKGLETQSSGLGGAAQTVAGKVPVIGSFGQTKEFQKMEQSKRQWVTALLRKESGAAISKDEYTQYDKQFFPQPGDAPEVVQQKAHERTVAVDAMKKTAGPSYKGPNLAKPPEAEGWTDLGGGVRIREKK